MTHLQRALASLLFAATAASAQTVSTQDDLREHLRACASCHGEHGEGLRGAEYFPHLAGKPAQYLFEQLSGFRDGRRANTQMTWFVQFLGDEFLHDIAAYYAALPPRTRAADASGMLMADAQRSTAETLVRHGDAARQVPACVACHGDNLAGIEPAVPALVALPEDYIVAQLGSWRAGIRRSTPPDCMHDVAMALTPDEIQSVAAWLARQSNREGSRPAPSHASPLPLDCGAQRERAP
jgi:cytochrome c553